MTENPKISVIVPMYNASKTIKSCIASLLALDYPNFEVIVVDDASTDKSVSMALELSCKLLILDENSGPGIARNKGVELASGEIIAFTDADCEVPRDWLRKIVRDFRNHNIAAISGGYSSSVNKGLIALFQFFDSCFIRRNVPQYINSCTTSNFSCKREIFDQVGGFSSQRIGEDLEFGLKLSKKYKILWNSGNGVAHHFDSNFNAYFRRQILYSENTIKVFLSSSGSIYKKTTWQNSEIFGHLLFTGLMYLSLVAVFWNSVSIIIFFILSAVYFLINMKFIKFVAKKKGYIFSFKVFPLLLIRNTAWLLGIVKVFLKHSSVNTLLNFSRIFRD